MDAPASHKANAHNNNVCGFYLEFDNPPFPPAIKQKNTVIKYTKLPDFDFDSKVSWPQHSYTLQPRLRRIIELDDPELHTSRSLKSSLTARPRGNVTNYTKRKIVTIAENIESSQTPKINRQQKTTNRSVTADYKNDSKLISQRTSSRLSNTSKDSRETKSSAKTNNVTKKDHAAPKTSASAKFGNINSQSITNNWKSRSTKDKEKTRNTKTSISSTPISVSKNLVTPSESESEINLIKNKIIENIKHVTTKRPAEKCRTGKSQSISLENKSNLLKDVKMKSKPITVIHVPLEEKYYDKRIDPQKVSKEDFLFYSNKKNNTADCSTEMDVMMYKDAKVGTPLTPELKNIGTGTQVGELAVLYDDCHKSMKQSIMDKEPFDSLDIPNVTLIKDKSRTSKEEIINFCSKSLPNLKIPTLKHTIESENNKNQCVGHSKNKSYIIGQATVTYTTKQKINFHVVSSSDDNISNLTPSPLAYPLNVVSVFKKQLKNCEVTDISHKGKSYNKKDKSRTQYTNLNELQSLNCSFVFNNNKLVKPSDIISTIRVNNGLLHNEYICEQFQRELNFIDSFFESLQYLESCSLSENCFPDDKCENWISKTGLDFKNSDYASFLSKLENGANIDDSETMASKSLCLLNLLIRDEQRRAKNLLFVLKMREDALKDFTKSQILWLENKKKQDNTDVSTLKKKQRGALLKLQHECGEMQRMRKALLTLSEKRKAALMKTRSNIELKLNNDVNVDQILLGKKKLKRNTAVDRNTAPLKCFDLSSSGCEENIISKPKLEVPKEEVPLATLSAEKCTQAGESIFHSTVLVDNATITAAENFVVVDGGYLNILFHNLSLPQIFSSGKQYEVNEEALRNIVNSSNNAHHGDLHDSDVVENFMDQIKNRESDRSTSPSTAHSLVDEFDQYYKGLSDEYKSPNESLDRDYHNTMKIHEIKDTYAQVSESTLGPFGRSSGHSTGTMTDGSVTAFNSSSEVLCFEQLCECETSSHSTETQALKGRDVIASSNQAGPLPVPPGEPATPEPPVVDSADLATSITSGSSNESSDQLCSSVSSMTPVHCEAEELRRQQLAIEREIKALEQQQCQLLVVREIPDKPPPPYTPPNNQSAKSPRMLLLDDSLEEIIQQHITNEEPHIDPTNPFDVFIQDICQESLERQRAELSNKPWHSHNLLPQKQELTPEKIARKATAEIKEILTGVKPTVVSGVGARRSDHIDDILFAEWRRCEPEWTALHADEAVVKNQVFESIFQKILSDTIEEYKRTVLRETTEPPE